MSGVTPSQTVGPYLALALSWPDGPFVVPEDGLDAATGAEVCGPVFTPDNRTIFLAIQHPGEDVGSTFERPSTRWPDFIEGQPPRPSVIAIVRKDGGEIGG